MGTATDERGRFGDAVANRVGGRRGRLQYRVAAATRAGDHDGAAVAQPVRRRPPRRAGRRAAPGPARGSATARSRTLITETLETTPKNATHWSTRSMAEHLGMSQSTVSRVWRAFGLAPHKQDSWKLSKDPQFVDKVRDIVGLYLDPPERALVLCVDEKTQVQALEPHPTDLPDAARHPGAGQPRLRPPRHLEPLRRARPGHRQGHRLAACPPSRPRVRRSSARSTPRSPPTSTCHVVLDNASTHKTPAIKRWLAAHPGSSCTSPRPAAPGSTSSSAGSPS